MGRAVVTDVQGVRRSDSNIGLPLQLLDDLRVYGKRAASKGPHFPRSNEVRVRASRSHANEAVSIPYGWHASSPW